MTNFEVGQFEQSNTMSRIGEVARNIKNYAAIGLAVAGADVLASPAAEAAPLRTEAECAIIATEGINQAGQKVTPFGNIVRVGQATGTVEVTSLPNLEGCAKQATYSATFTLMRDAADFRVNSETILFSNLKKPEKPTVDLLERVKVNDQHKVRFLATYGDKTVAYDSATLTSVADPTTTPPPQPPPPAEVVPPAVTMPPTPVVPPKINQPPAVTVENDVPTTEQQTYQQKLRVYCEELATTGAGYNFSVNGRGAGKGRINGYVLDAGDPKCNGIATRSYSTFDVVERKGPSKATAISGLVRVIGTQKQAFDKKLGLRDCKSRQTSRKLAVRERVTFTTGSNTRTKTIVGKSLKQRC